MPPTLADRLVHILSAIDTIQTILKGRTLDEFRSNIPLRLAVERALEIVCEASRRIPENIKAGQKAIDWQRMADFGNLLRHAYHRIERQVVFEIAARDLSPLKSFAEGVIREAEE